jgi:proline dehydrogenase
MAFFIGMKLVRGAYMEKEPRAEENAILTHYMCFYEATDLNYDTAVQYMLLTI